MKRTWLYLSFPLSSHSPAYGGGEGFFEEKVKQMKLGDSSNTSKWSLSSHIGTHLDFPRHFTPNGTAMDGYGPEFFVFHKIHVADISPVKPVEIIGPDEMDMAQASADIDFLLIKTGFGQLRGEPVYWEKNPGFTLIWPITYEGIFLPSESWVLTASRCHHMLIENWGKRHTVPS